MFPSAKLEKVKTLLRNIERDYAPAAFATSFGVEDMVLLDILSKEFPEIQIFTLDTGRLPEQTYALMQQVRNRYGDIVAVFFPECNAIQGYIVAHGPNAFYESVELRKACCRVRKLEPLKRALFGKKAWITGLRREQSVTRQDLSIMEWDSVHELTKFNPLVNWSEQEIWAYVKQYDIPYNALHDQNYPSIGCAPCTRGVKEHEDIRAGRWWWENPYEKECGLHAREGQAVTV